MKSSGKDILVVGVDGIGEAYDSIRRGELDATIDSFPFYKAQIAGEVMLRRLGGQEIPRVLWTPQALIDSENVDKPAEELSAGQTLYMQNRQRQQGNYHQPEGQTLADISKRG